VTRYSGIATSCRGIIQTEPLTSDFIIPFTLRLFNPSSILAAVGCVCLPVSLAPSFHNNISIEPTWHKQKTCIFLLNYCFPSVFRGRP
jgi:hypothetical protein